MIRTLRAHFLNRALREKLLLVGFLGVCVIMWATAYSSRASRFWHRAQRTTVDLADQDRWLARRTDIEAATQSAASQMDPAKTLDGTALTVTVRQLASDAGVGYVSGPVVPGPNVGQFSINNLSLTVTNCDWRAFASFYQHLQERNPYLAITELAMLPVPRNPAQINATLRVQSFEIKH